MIKIERAFSVILRASLATCCSFQQLLQLPTVAAASNSCCSIQQLLQLPTVAATSSSCCNLWKLSRIRFHVPNWIVVSKSRKSSPVTAWYNYIIMATFEGWKQPQGLKQPSLVSCAAPVQCFQNCFKLFQIVIASDQQPACHSMIVICLINKVGDQFNTQ